MNVIMCVDVGVVRSPSAVVGDGSYPSATPFGHGVRPRREPVERFSLPEGPAGQRAI